MVYCLAEERTSREERTLHFMQKRRVVLSVLSNVILLAVVTLIGLLSHSSAARASEAVNEPQSMLKDQYNQSHDSGYPDPTNQGTLPANVKVTGNGETVLLHASVTEGYQIYECKASTTDPSGFAWQIQAPFAFLKANDGTNVIHSTGPTWLYTKDGSEIRAKVGQFTNPNGSIVPASATPDANAIPWLRLDVTDHRGNTGLFSKVDQVQRLYTRAGKAPVRGCDQNVAKNHVILPVHYTAEYVFWGR